MALLTIFCASLSCELHDFYFDPFKPQPNSTIASVESSGSNASRKSWTRQYHTVNKTSTVVSKTLKLNISCLSFFFMVLDF